AARELGRYRASVSRRIGKRHVWLDAHGEALAAELLRDRGLKTAAAVRAREVKAAYRRLGAEGAVRRTTLSAWASAGPPVAAARRPSSPDRRRSRSCNASCPSRLRATCHYCPSEKARRCSSQTPGSKRSSCA